MSANSDFATWGRYKEIPLDKMTPDQKRVYQLTMKEPTNLTNGRWLAAYSNYEHEIIGEREGGLPSSARRMRPSREDIFKRGHFSVTGISRGASPSRHSIYRSRTGTLLKRWDSQVAAGPSMAA
jgi:hypothetical protein